MASRRAADLEDEAALVRQHLAGGLSLSRWAIRWKPALNAFAIAFEGRIVPSTTN